MIATRVGSLRYWSYARNAFRNAACLQAPQASVTLIQFCLEWSHWSRSRSVDYNFPSDQSIRFVSWVHSSRKWFNGADRGFKCCGCLESMKVRVVRIFDTSEIICEIKRIIPNIEWLFIETHLIIKIGQTFNLVINNINNYSMYCINIIINKFMDKLIIISMIQKVWI